MSVVCSVVWLKSFSEPDFIIFKHMYYAVKRRVVYRGDKSFRGKRLVWLDYPYRSVQLNVNPAIVASVNALCTRSGKKNSFTAGLTASHIVMIAEKGLLVWRYTNILSTQNRIRPWLCLSTNCGRTYILL